MNEMETIRTPEIIGAEIRTLTQQAKYITLYYAMEIGRRLHEAHELIGHGEWLKWLSENTEFSQPTASRYMSVYKQYAEEQSSLFGAEAKYSTLNNISVSNALRLLAIPEEEREQFAKENDVEHLSARELDEIIAQRDAALRGKQDAEARAEQSAQVREDTEAINRELRDKLKAIRADMDEIEKTAEQEKAEMQKQIRELESRPVEVAVQRDEKAILEAAEEAKKQSTEKWKGAVEELKKQLSEAQEVKAQAEHRAQIAEDNAEKITAELREQLTATEKKLSAASKGTATFAVRFETVQTDFNKLLAALREVRGNDAELGEKLRTAVLAVLDKCRKEIDE